MLVLPTFVFRSLEYSHNSDSNSGQTVHTLVKTIGIQKHFFHRLSHDLFTLNKNIKLYISEKYTPTVRNDNLFRLQYFLSVSNEVQNLFSTFRVVRNDFLKSIFKTVAQKIAR